MSAAPVRELYYRLPGVAGGARPGSHRSRQGEGGFEYRASVPLEQARDLRRLDLPTSLRDPFGRWSVRQYSQRLALSVVLLADVSASMADDARPPRRQVLADLADSLAASAWRQGDRFGLLACDEQVRPDLLLLPTRQRGAGQAMAARLRTAPWAGRSSGGLLQAWRLLPRQRALVFLASDFLLPLDALRAVLASLAHHAVVPVVLQPAAAPPADTRQGWLTVADAETGRRQLLWWRPALRDRLLAAEQARRDALQRLFAAHQLRPLHLPGRFDADAVTRHFVA